METPAMAVPKGRAAESNDTPPSGQPGPSRGAEPDKPRKCKWMWTSINEEQPPPKKSRAREMAQAARPPRPEPAIGSQGNSIQVGNPKSTETPQLWAHRADEALTTVVAIVHREIKVDSFYDDDVKGNRLWLNDRDGRGVMALRFLQPFFAGGRCDESPSRIAATMVICMFLWPHKFPNDRAVSYAGFWLNRSTSHKPEERFKINRTLVTWRRAFKDLTTQIMARSGFDRAKWVRVHYPLAKPLYKKGSLELRQVEEEPIPAEIVEQYRTSLLYLPLLTVGYVSDDRMDRHTEDAIKKWQAARDLLQMGRQRNDPPTERSS